jgi:hypothetical protein
MPLANIALLTSPDRNVGEVLAAGSMQWLNVYANPYLSAGTSYSTSYIYETGRTLNELYDYCYSLDASVTEDNIVASKLYYSGITYINTVKGTFDDFTKLYYARFQNLETNTYNGNFFAGTLGNQSVATIRRYTIPVANPVPNTMYGEVGVSKFCSGGSFKFYFTFNTLKTLIVTKYDTPLVDPLAAIDGMTVPLVAVEKHPYSGNGVSAYPIGLVDNFVATSEGRVTPLNYTSVRGVQLLYPACIGHVSFRPRQEQRPYCPVGLIGPGIVFSETLPTITVKNQVFPYTNVPYSSIDNNRTDYGSVFNTNVYCTIIRLRKVPVAYNTSTPSPVYCTPYISTGAINHSTMKTHVIVEAHTIQLTLSTVRIGNTYKLIVAKSIVSVVNTVIQALVSPYSILWYPTARCSARVAASAQAAVDMETTFTNGSLVYTSSTSKSSSSSLSTQDIPYNGNISIDDDYKTGYKYHVDLTFNDIGRLTACDFSIDTLTAGANETIRHWIQHGTSY